MFPLEFFLEKKIFVRQTIRPQASSPVMVEHASVICLFGSHELYENRI